MAETTSLARRLASPEVLCDLDHKLTETVTQMGWALARTEEVAMLDAVLATFDLDALQSQATRTMKKKCIGVHLLTAGGYNIVFLLPFDDGTDVLARLRFPGDGREGHDYANGVSEQELAERFSSEVATLRFLKTRTSIPVPELYHWDADAANPVGTRYMLMQRFSAELLINVFNDMTPAGRENLVTQIATFEADLYDNSLGSIGVLIDENGTIGPFGPSCNNRGPFTSSKQLLLACVDTELDLITRRPEEWTNERAVWGEVNGGVEVLPADYAAQLLQLLKSAIGRLPDELSSSPPVFRLAHTDFNSGNILVLSAEDPTIVAVIDWEDARVVPAWDARVGCDLSWICWDIPSVEDGKALQKIYNDITTADGRSRGTSALCLQDLLSLLEGWPTRRLDQKRLNNELLAWLASAESSGKKCCSLELESFRGLKEFIEVSLRVLFRARAEIWAHT
ncbi:kinase-like domain-containing protein [Mycena epipterygia]|nr:kinase-like domain-containing protein [Mycena epipterygia]